MTSTEFSPYSAGKDSEVLTALKQTAANVVPRDQFERQQLLLECSRLLISGPSTGAELAQLVFEKVRRHLNADLCFKYRVDPSKNELHLVAGVGIPAEMLPAAQSFPVGKCLCGQIAATGEALIADAKRIAVDPEAAFAREIGARAYVGFPLRSREGVVIGTFAVASRYRDSFSEEEVSFLETLCHLIGAAVQRAVEHQALRQSERRYHAMLESLAEGVVMQNGDGQLTECNARAEELLGLKRDELLERYSVDSRWQTFRGDGSPFPAEEHPAMVTLRTGQPQKDVVMGVQRPDGTRQWISVCSALVEHPGQPGSRSVVTSFSDITERRRMEEALVEQSIARTHAMPGISRLSPDGIYQMVNEFYASTLGYEVNELLGANWEPTVFKDDLPNALAAYHEMVAKGQGEFEARAVRKDGSIFWKQVLMVRLQDADGKHTGHYCFMRDVSGRVEAERVLREERLFLHETEKIARVGGWKTNPDTDALRWTDGVRHIIEVPMDYQPGLKEGLEFYLPDERAKVAAALERTLATGEPFLLETRIQTTSGKVLWTELRGFARLIESGKTSIYGTFQDITQRKESERRLREQLARTGLLNNIVRAIGERTDLETILFIVACNLEDHLPVDFSMLCLAEGEGKKLAVAALGPDSQQLAESAGFDEGTRLSFISSGLERCAKGDLVYEAQLAQTEGTWASALTKAGLGAAVFAPLQMKEKVFGVLIAARRQPDSFSATDCDFLRHLGEHVALATHQSQLNAALQTVNDELRASREAALQQERLRALGQMASGVAHDINNSISPILIYSDLLLQTEPDLKEESKDFLRTIQRATQDVAGTVARLREFYRKREAQNELFPVQLNRLAKEVVNVTRARWVDIPQERGIVVDMHTDLVSTLPDVDGIEGEIREALINLIFNAVDALPKGGAITLKTGFSSELQRIFIEVADSGMGMDEETRQRCIEPFFTTKGERGTGLGLAMVCGVMQRHDGEIAIESTPGHGTTVRLLFPIPKGSVVSPPPRRAITTVPRLKILVVDDDALITTALQLGLRIDGHEVRIANGGEAGIAAFREAKATSEPFQLVITDLGMPKVDGREVAQTVKAEQAGTLVILLTGWGQRLLDEEQVPQHVDRVLSKPPKLNDIRSTIAELVPAAGI